MKTKHVPSHSFDPISLLKQAGFKATPGRISLLNFLFKQKEPLTVTAIASHLPLDPVTLYRALETMAEHGIVGKIDFRHAHTHYELIVGKTHHHHMVCTDCGTVEDIEACHSGSFEQAALKNSKKFAAITAHSLEFFGTCKKCTLA